MVTLEAFWNIFSNFFSGNYPFAVMLFIGAILLSKGAVNKESYNWLYTINTILLWIVLADLTFFIANLFAAWYGQNPYEWYAFKNDSLYGIRTFFILFALGSIVHLAFFYRPWRSNIFITLLVLFFRNIPLLLNLLQQYFRDYLPSSWSTYYTESFITNLICWIGSVLLFVFTYWGAYKRKKLPYPSIIIKQQCTPFSN